MFPGLESRQHDFPVLMRRRGDDNSLHVFVREQLGVRRIPLGLGRATEAATQISRVSVAHRDYRRVGNGRQRLEQPSPPDATTDDPDADRRRAVVLRSVVRLAKRLRR